MRDVDKNMSVAHVVDIAGLLAAIGCPVYFIWRLRWYVGVVLGAVGFWLILHFTGQVLSYLDPSREARPADDIWLTSGWLAGLVLSLIVLLTKLALVKAIQRRKLSERNT